MWKFDYYFVSRGYCSDRKYMIGHRGFQQEDRFKVAAINILFSVGNKIIIICNDLFTLY